SKHTSLSRDWCSVVFSSNLQYRKIPPTNKIKACPLKSALNQLQLILNQGFFMAMSNVIPNNIAIRINIAKKSPIRVALLRCSSGSFPVTIEMKMMLSIPSTTSKKVKVAKAAHVSGLDKNSIVLVFDSNCKSIDRKSTRLNSSHVKISYAVFCLK